MSNTLDVFSLRDAVVDDYRQFATSFTTIHAGDIREQVEAIYAGGTYWPDPLIQISPRYQSTVNVQALVDSGQLHPATAEIFRADGVPLSSTSINSRRSRLRRMAKVTSSPRAPVQVSR